MCTQPIVVGMGTVIGYSIPALFLIMDLYEVEDRKLTFKKVQLLWDLTQEDRSGDKSNV
jgi:hypothetical protein